MRADRRAYMRRYRKSYDARNPAATKRWRLQSRYRLTPEQLAEKSRRQGDRCQICRRRIELVIDHDHATGRVRSLLCRACNLMIGYAREDPLILERAAAYVTPSGKMSELADPA